MKIGDLVFGRLKNNDNFQGSIVGISEDGTKVRVNRCSLSPVKIGKEYKVPKKNIKKITNINYDKLSNDDVWHISVCMGYGDLEEKSILNQASLPIETEPSKREMAIFDENVKKMREQLREKIKNDF
jgi:hypothetical protein